MRSLHSGSNAGRLLIAALATFAGAGCDGTADGLQSAETAADAPSPPPLLPDVPASTYGNIQGQLQVDRMGQAQYTIPIDIPPGRAGFAPELAFSYTTGGGDGPLGVGWTFGLTSRISRCPTTPAAHHQPRREVRHDSGDKFCLDGVPLIPLPSNGFPATDMVLTPENNPRVRVVGHMNNVNLDASTWDVDSFEIHFPDGRKSYLGRAPSSRIRGIAHRTVQWLTDRVRDADFNVIEYEHSKLTTVFTLPDASAADPADAGVVLSRVRWGGSARPGAAQDPRFSVKLVYGPQGHASSSVAYELGQSHWHNRRLDAVEVRVGNTEGTLVSAYKLTYDESPFTARSLLRSIQRCAYASQNGALVESCLTPHKFTYSGTPPSTSNVTMTPVTNPLSTVPHLGPLLADIDGDGRSDLVYSRDVSSGHDDYHQGIFFRPGLPRGAGTAVFGQEKFATYYVQAAAGGIVSDFDDNGALDFMLYPPGCPVGSYRAGRAPCGWQLLLMPAHASYSSSEGSTSPIAIHTADPLASPTDQWADLDGDNLPDGLLCRVFDDPNDQIAPAEIYFVRWNNGGGNFGPPLPVANFDASGVIQFPFLCDARQRPPLFVDINGDGALDAVRPGPRLAGNPPVLTNQGVVQFATFANRVIRLDQVFSPTFEGKFLGLGSATATDYNADGLSDLAWYDRDPDAGQFKLHILANTGDPRTLFTNPIDTDMHRAALNPPPLADALGMTPGAVDFDGDGRADFFELEQTRLVIATAKNLFQTGGPRPNDPYAIGLDLQIAQDHGQPFFGDIDGDGMTDVLLPRQFGDVQVIRVAKAVPDQLVGIHAWNDDNVKTIEVAYGQLSDSAVYTREAGCSEAAGTVCIGGSQANVVKSVKYDMGVGVPRSETTYAYVNGRRERGTLRWLGFERVKSTEVRSGEITTSTYDLTSRGGAHQWLTKLGMLTSRTVATPVGARWHISSDRYEHTTFELNGGFITTESERAHAVYDRASLAPCAAPEDCRALEAHWTSVVLFDPLGFPTETEKSDTTSVRRATLVYFPHDTTNWIFGRIQTESVTDFMPNGVGTKSRNRSWTYRPGSPKIETYTIREADDPRQLITRFDYDSYGNNRSTCVRDVARAEERCTTVEYDAAYSLWPIRVTDPLGHAVTTTMHPMFGQLRQLIDPNGEVQNVQFDSLGRVVREVAPDGSETTFELAAETAPGPVEGKVIRRTTNAPAVTTGLDRLGRVLTTGWASYDDRTKRHVVQRTYDAAGLVREIKGPYYLGVAPAADEAPIPVTQFEYDALDRPKRLIRPNGGEVTWTYEPGLGLDEPWRGTLGQRVKRTDENGHQRVIETDGGGRVERTVDALGGATKFAFGAFGLPQSSIDALGRETVFEYDAYGDRDAMTDPILGRQQFDVDAFSQIRSITEEATGLRTSIDYDRLGRRTRRTAGAEVSTWTYDYSSSCGTSLTCAAAEHTIGRLVSSLGPDGDGKRYRFDAFGRLAAETHLIRARSYTYDYSYDAAGRLDVLNYPVASDGWRFAVKHEYVNGQLAIVRNAADNNALWVKERETAAAQTKRVSFGNGLATQWRYTRDGHVSTIATGAPGQPALSSTAYDYDLAGNVIARRDLRQSMTEHFIYDELDRLTSNCFENGVAEVPSPVPASNDALSHIAAPAPDVPEHGMNGTTDAAPAPTDGGNASRWAAYSASPLTGPEDTAIAISSRMPMGNDGIFAAETQYRRCSSYAYDALGNFEWREGVGAYEYPATTDSGREIHAPSLVVHPSGSTSIKYTAGGRIKQFGSSEYTYTAIGALRSVNLSSGLRSQTAPALTTFRYDADGLRTEKRTGAAVTSYAGRLFEEENSTSGSVPAALTFDANTREARVKLSADGRIFGEVIHHLGALRATAFDPTRAPWVPVNERPAPLSRSALNRVHEASTQGTATIVYFHADPQGTTELVTDSGKATAPGRVVERRSYEPFGRVRSPDWSAGTDAPAVGRRNVGYTGHIEDEETGLISMVARDYSPILARFLTPDTYVPAPLDSQSHNRYAYGLNNPLTYADPTGYAPKKPEHIVFDDLIVTAQIPRPRPEFIRKPMLPRPGESEPETAAPSAPPPGPQGDRDPPLAIRRTIQTPGHLARLYRAYGDVIGAMGAYVQGEARRAGDFVQDVTGSDIAGAYTATYIETTAGAPIGLLGIGLLPEAVINSAGDFDHGLEMLADGIEQEDPYRAWLGAAKVAGAVGTVAGAIATVAGGVAAAKAGASAKGGGGGARFIADDAGRVVDTHATPPGRYIQPDKSATDIVQAAPHSGLDPFTARTHTHPAELHVNPADPSKARVQMGSPRPVNLQEVLNIVDGTAIRAKPLGRGR